MCAGEHPTKHFIWAQGRLKGGMTNAVALDGKLGVGGGSGDFPSLLPIPVCHSFKKTRSSPTQHKHFFFPIRCGSIYCPSQLQPLKKPHPALFRPSHHVLSFSQVWLETVAEWL